MRTILRWSTVISLTMIFSLMILEVGVLAKKKRKRRNSQTTVAKQTQRASLIVPLIVQTTLAEMSTNQDIDSSGLKSSIKPLAKTKDPKAPVPNLPTTAGQLIISEFRLRGLSGANDEFIEL